LDDLKDYFSSRKIPTTSIADGLELPSFFSAVEKEYWAVRKSVGIFDFSFMSTVEIIGHDVRSMLALIQSRDCNNLDIGKIFYTMLLDKQGLVWLDATIWHLDEDRFWIITGCSITQYLHQISKLFKDIFIKDLSCEYQYIAIQGPKSGELICKFFNLSKADLPHFFSFIPRFSINGALLARLGYTKEIGYELVVPKKFAINIWKDLSSDQIYLPAECGFLAADILRIEAGYILYSKELLKPRQLGINKKCHLKDLVKIRFTKEKQIFKKTNLFTKFQQPVVEVTSKVFSPSQGCYIGLGFSKSAELNTDIVELAYNEYVG
jgi:aminomethyltransferase